MARVRGGGGAADDLLKLLVGMWGDDAAKAGAKAAKKAKAPAKKAAKAPAKAPAKKVAKAPAKKASPKTPWKADATRSPSTQVIRDIASGKYYGYKYTTGGQQSRIPVKPTKPRKKAATPPLIKMDDVPSMNTMGTMGGPTKKGPKGKPERPRMTREQWLESQANKRLRRADGTPPKGPERDARMGEAPNIPRVPKRSKSKPKGRRSDYEADKSRAEIAEDRRRFRGTRPAPRKPKGVGKK